MQRVVARRPHAVRLRAAGHWVVVSGGTFCSLWPIACTGYPLDDVKNVRPRWCSGPHILQA
eukprot:scaffold225_cov388-Prasinococcus_capsulatus_cf.AAC.46